MEKPLNLACPGCGAAVDPEKKEGQATVTIVALGAKSSSLYCARCAFPILELVRRPSKGSVSISEPLVREIAGNLGASVKLTDALIESIFGPGWTGEIPEGAVMNRYTNRDRLVAFVAGKLKDLWTLEA